jgi:hypothetical protein
MVSPDAELAVLGNPGGWDGELCGTTAPRQGVLPCETASASIAVALGGVLRAIRELGITLAVLGLLTSAMAVAMPLSGAQCRYR